MAGGKPCSELEGGGPGTWGAGHPPHAPEQSPAAVPRRAGLSHHSPGCLGPAWGGSGQPHTSVPKRGSVGAVHGRLRSPAWLHGAQLQELHSSQAGGWQGSEPVAAGLLGTACAAQAALADGGGSRLSWGLHAHADNSAGPVTSAACVCLRDRIPTCHCTRKPQPTARTSVPGGTGSCGFAARARESGRERRLPEPCLMPGCALEHLSVWQPASKAGAALGTWGCGS